MSSSGRWGTRCSSLASLKLLRALRGQEWADLHYARPLACRALNDWQLPPEGVRPPGTYQAGDLAVQTPFQGGQHVAISFPEVRCARPAAAACCGATCAGWDAEMWRALARGVPCMALQPHAGQGSRTHGPRPFPHIHKHAHHPETTPLPQAGCPAKMVFVLKENEEWTNNGDSDFTAYLKPPGVEGGWGWGWLCFPGGRRGEAPLDRAGAWLGGHGQGWAAWQGRDAAVAVGGEGVVRHRAGGVCRFFISPSLWAKMAAP